MLHRKVCNHPALVCDLVDGVAQCDPSYKNSAKLLGLLDILSEMEIIQTNSGEEQAAGTLLAEAKQPHRALIFCQMGSFMSLVEEQVLRHFGVKYLTLVSSMSPKERLEVADQFN